MPQLQDDGDGFRIIFPRVHAKDNIQNADIVQDGNQQPDKMSECDGKNQENVGKETDTAGNSGVKVQGFDGDVGKTIDEQILQLLQVNPAILQKELATMLHLSDRTIERHIRQLKEQGKLTRIGGRQKGSWLVNVGKATQT